MCKRSCRNERSGRSDLSRTSRALLCMATGAAGILIIGGCAATGPVPEHWTRTYDPRRYGKDMVADTWIGDGRRALNAADVESALMLYRVAGILIMLVLASSATTFLGN